MELKLPSSHVTHAVTVCLNCTFMELKYAPFHEAEVGCAGLNCTFMELKLAKHTKNGFHGVPS